ncbi:hypothetical protein F5B19DRAFT_488438 [Rostrohypoxylon terebratum]|nr:hypothetical protein F5B19DRAFT_488438 [Rostrohypoxylon terebratum]
MAKEAVTPTLITIIFIFFTGLYGFVKFSYEKTRVDAAHTKTIPIATEIYPPGLPTPTPTNHGNISLNEPTRLLFTYVYTESPTARVNLVFFLDNGLHGDADFIFILNGPTDVADLIPSRDNIQVIPQSSVCSDLIAHGGVLRKDDLWKNYDQFIMLSSAVRGPFMPFWSRGCWSGVFLNRITENVKLVGMKANCLPKFRIESMVWATDTVGMGLLLGPPKSSSVPDMPDQNHNQVVATGDHVRQMKQLIHHEVEVTRAIKSSGYKVDTLTSSPEIEDLQEICATDSIEGAAYGNHDGVHPYETIFVKTSQDTDSITVARLTELHQSRYMNGSWDVCHGVF